MLKRINKENRNKTHDINKILISKIKQKQQTRCNEDAAIIEEEIKEVKRQLANSMEMKQLATEKRIKNYYKSNIDKNVPVTFACMKEKNRSREISEIEIEGRKIENCEEIVETMQKWYETTANTETEQTNTLINFLAQNNIRMPQITEEQKQEIEVCKSCLTCYTLGLL